MDLNRFYRQSQLATDRMTAQTMRRIQREYRDSLKVIDSQLAAIHRKYAVGGELSMSEMTKYNRLANLEKGINKELGRLGGTNTRSVKRLAGDIYHESFYRTAFAIERGTQLNLAFGQLSPNQVLAAIENPLMDIALVRNQQLAREGIKREITQGIIQGLSYPDMAKNLQRRMEGNLNNVDRIARTEAHRAREMGDLRALQHAESKGVIMQKMWVSALDEHTRDTHQELDGQTVGVDEYFVSPEGHEALAPGLFGVAEEDINCRCSKIGVIEGYGPTVRRAEEGLMPYQTYREWKEAKHNN